MTLSNRNQEIQDLKSKYSLLEKKHIKMEKELAQLLGITFDILETDNFEIVASKIFNACAQSIGAKAGYVALLSEDGSENELLFLEDGGMPCTVDQSLPMPIRGLREDAYKTGRVVYDNDFMKSSWVKFMPKGHMPLKNVLFAPLNIEGKTVGIMGFALKDGDFNEHDASIAAAFGDYAAIALRNSRNISLLEQKNRLLSRLFSIMGHDLRTPVNLINGYAQLLNYRKDNISPEQSTDYAEKIQKAVFQTTSLLENILLWANSQNNSVPVNLEDISPLTIVSEALEYIAPLAEHKNISLINNITDRKISADRNILTAIFRNLLSNAVKFTKSGGTIIVDASQKEHEIIFSVKDNGVGISSTQIENILADEKASSTNGTDGEKGTGLGLTICKDFISLCRGKFWIESELNEGSVFYFSLPCKN